MPAGFKDLFSRGSVEYAAFRPTYPAALFAWLASRCPGRGLAWDCATGNGQAALGLAEHFLRVVATDASPEQIASAGPHPRVEYRVALAESSGLPDGAADLATVAQALHWLDRPAFYAEARRVLRPGGVIAAWCYNLLRIAPEIDALIFRLYSVTLAGFWSADRALVDQGYRTVELPFEELAAPEFEMASDWTLPRLLGYLRTWSATLNYQAERGEDPVRSLEAELGASWGDPETARRVSWPLSFRVGRAGDSPL